MISRRSLLIFGGASLGFLGCSKSEELPATCPKTPLSPQAEQLRVNLKYVERSKDPAKFCSACTQYKPALGNQCGGCSLLEGPIHPEATCAAFSPNG